MTELIADNLETTGALATGGLRTRYVRRPYRAPRERGEYRRVLVHAGAGSIRSPSVR